MNSYGGLFNIGGRIFPDDGLIDVLLLPRTNFIGIARFALAGLFGILHSVEELQHLKMADYVKITSETPVSVQIDGDHMGFTPFTVKKMDEKLKLLVP